jgi:hypothetical protein
LISQLQQLWTNRLFQFLFGDRLSSYCGDDGIKVRRMIGLAEASYW